MGNPLIYGSSESVVYPSPDQYGPTQCQSDFLVLKTAAAIKADTARMEQLRRWMREARNEFDQALDSFLL